ncbi:MAG: ankyrin repeat domain-containing protein, partial [Spirochaetaceae bacterium]|nr:ankyrin repeat domain-containing protein [Spirochaetaceae bacterium]
MKRIMPVLVLFLAAGVVFGQSLLEIARTGTPGQIEAAIKAGASLEERDGSGLTPLMAAAVWNTDQGVAEALLKAGAAVDARDNYCMTALMWAARWNTNPALVKVLLKAGA